MARFGTWSHNFLHHIWQEDLFVQLCPGFASKRRRNDMGPHWAIFASTKTSLPKTHLRQLGPPPNVKWRCPKPAKSSSFNSHFCLFSVFSYQSKSKVWVSWELDDFLVVVISRNFYAWLEPVRRALASWVIATAMKVNQQSTRVNRFTSKANNRTANRWVT